jgi:CDP-diacylglycerol--glycerol-3-phosphate 3-phosphatidyltransferase
MSSPKSIPRTEAESEPKRGAVIGRESLNMPNFVTATRLLLSIVLFSMITSGGWWISSAALFVFAASTDALDGYLARKYKQITVLGRILDPFVDKVIVCGTFRFSSRKAGTHRAQVSTHGWSLSSSDVRCSSPACVESWRKRARTFSASLSGKLKMSVQCVAVTASLLSLSAPIFRGRGFQAVRDVLLWIAVAITVWSGFVYLLRGFSLLRQG